MRMGSISIYNTPADILPACTTNHHPLLWGIYSTPDQKILQSLALITRFATKVWVMFQNAALALSPLGCFSCLLRFLSFSPLLRTFISSCHSDRSLPTETPPTPDSQNTSPSWHLRRQLYTCLPKRCLFVPPIGRLDITILYRVQKAWRNLASQNARKPRLSSSRQITYK